MVGSKLSPCIKQTVMAAITTKNNEIIFGFNGINNKDVLECPRVLENMKTGEGYHLCKEVCNQASHAEVEAINNANINKIDIKDSSLYLIGHTYCCDNCLDKISKAGIKELFILDENDKTILFYDIKSLQLDKLNSFVEVRSRNWQNDNPILEKEFKKIFEDCSDMVENGIKIEIVNILLEL